MNPKQLLVYCILILMVSCSTKDLDCSNFKTGNFVYPKYPGVELMRTNSTQIESYETENFERKNNFEDIYSITWTDDCNYFMIFQSTTNEALLHTSSLDTMFVEIVETTDSSYNYKSSKNDEYYEGQLIKVR